MRDCLAAVICGGDSGVNVTDALSEALNLRGNGTLSSGHRRDKWVQQEALKAAGVRHARTVCGATWKQARLYRNCVKHAFGDKTVSLSRASLSVTSLIAVSQVATFAETEQYPLVVKPIESAGADGFKLCHSVEEVPGFESTLWVSEKLVPERHYIYMCVCAYIHIYIYTFHSQGSSLVYNYRCTQTSTRCVLMQNVLQLETRLRELMHKLRSCCESDNPFRHGPTLSS